MGAFRVLDEVQHRECHNAYGPRMCSMCNAESDLLGWISMNFVLEGYSRQLPMSETWWTAINHPRLA